jgi:hypothetical protein
MSVIRDVTRGDDHWLSNVGAAAALVSNPILLQLGVITGKKRRRRDSDAGLSQVRNPGAEGAAAVQQKLNEIALLERFMAQVNIVRNI